MSYFARSSSYSNTFLVSAFTISQKCFSLGTYIHTYICNLFKMHLNTMEPLFCKFLGIMSDFLYPSNSKRYEKEQLIKDRYTEQTLPVAQRPFVISRFHCIKV